jgi:hypothetical protein
VRWRFSAEATADEAGIMDLTQLITVKKPTAMKNCVDNFEPYSNSARLDASLGEIWGNSDSPASSANTDYDAFNDYFIYKPDGEDSIWVSLSHLQWSWSAQGVPLTIFEQVRQTKGDGVLSLPTWNCTFKNQLPPK